ncbi:hypothetical protein CBF23_012995 [Marinomonas agarivorans]|nr:hypothetical protein CBF23_012995 [Marinomonas agarivorans]
MELLVLILAMIVRTLFVQPQTSAVGVRRGVTSLVERLVGNDEQKLLLLFVVILVSGCGITFLFGNYLTLLLESALFIYFFSILYINFSSSLVADSLDKSELLQRLEEYGQSTGVTEKDSYSSLAAKLCEHWLNQFFIASFVLMFWYFVMGWFGLLVYGFVYYIQPMVQPLWLRLLRRFLEMPAGILAGLSCAVAGRMDAVITELFAWKIKRFELGYEVFKASAIASIGLQLNEKDFYNGMLSLKRLCLRSLYVWLFVIALIIIV